MKDWQKYAIGGFIGSVLTQPDFEKLREAIRQDLRQEILTEIRAKNLAAWEREKGELSKRFREEVWNELRQKTYGAICEGYSDGIKSKVEERIDFFWPFDLKYFIEKMFGVSLDIEALDYIESKVMEPIKKNEAVDVFKLGKEVAKQVKKRFKVRLSGDVVPTIAVSIYSFRKAIQSFIQSVIMETFQDFGLTIDWDVKAMNPKVESEEE